MRLAAELCRCFGSAALTRQPLRTAPRDGEAGDGGERSCGVCTWVLGDASEKILSFFIFEERALREKR